MYLKVHTDLLNEDITYNTNYSLEITNEYFISLIIKVMSIIIYLPTYKQSCSAMRFPKYVL